MAKFPPLWRSPGPNPISAGHKKIFNEEYFQASEGLLLRFCWQTCSITKKWQVIRFFFLNQALNHESTWDSADIKMVWVYVNTGMEPMAEYKTGFLKHTRKSQKLIFAYNEMKSDPRLWWRLPRDWSAASSTVISDWTCGASWKWLRFSERGEKRESIWLSRSLDLIHHF